MMPEKLSDKMFNRQLTGGQINARHTIWLVTGSLRRRSEV